MTRTYLDSGVLIAAARGNDEPALLAFALLAESSRVFVSSVFVRLEIMPKPIYLQRQDEVVFYETFFAEVASWVDLTPELAEGAYRYAAQYGLSALDALHVAASIALGADELITVESEGKPIHRVTALRVVSLQPDK
jgi:predicted nucleic acid-binding protein